MKVKELSFCQTPISMELCEINQTKFEIENVCDIMIQGLENKSF